MDDQTTNVRPSADSPAFLPAIAWRNGTFEIPTYFVSPDEVRALAKMGEALGAAFNRADAPTQLQIASFGALHVSIAAPALALAIGGAMKVAPIHRVRGLPVEGEGAALIATVLSLLRGGEVFQYVEQLGGMLTAPIEPKVGGASNSNSSPEPFGIHTDDAIMPSIFRVEEIALLGVYNPAGTLTGFALVESIL